MKTQIDKISALHIAVHCRSIEGDKGEQSTDQQSSINEDKPDDQIVEIVRVLCKSGARVNIKDAKNLTPLHYACRVNNYVSLPKA